MAYLSDYQYYTNAVEPAESANWGSYQYVSLADIVNNFLLMHTGDNNLVNGVSRYKVLFLAKRAIQELNYDAFKEVKVLELKVDDNLRLILPPDFVNWVRISIFKNGVIYPMTENIQINSSKSFSQDVTGILEFDDHDNLISIDPSGLEAARRDGTAKSIYLNSDSKYDGVEGYNVDGRWFFDFSVGARFGLNTSTANANPTFRIDKKAGVINFSSIISGESCILEYVSDGMEGGDDSAVSVNKFFESYLYASIKYDILNDRVGVQEYVVERARKQKSALLRNARIRISNMTPSRLLMSMRGRDKIIK